MGKDGLRTAVKVDTKKDPWTENHLHVSADEPNIMDAKS